MHLLYKKRLPTLLITRTLTLALGFAVGVFAPPIVIAPPATRIAVLMEAVIVWSQSFCELITSASNQATSS